MASGFDYNWFTWARMLLVGLGVVVGLLGLGDFRLGRSGMAVVLLFMGAMAVFVGVTNAVFPGQLF
ncbi:MAG: hypothetical protein ACYC5Y_10160 [Symbiobacteriia bacterium]